MNILQNTIKWNYVFFIYTQLFILRFLIYVMTAIWWHLSLSMCWVFLLEAARDAGVTMELSPHDRWWCHSVRISQGKPIRCESVWVWGAQTCVCACVSVRESAFVYITNHICPRLAELMHKNVFLCTRVVLAVRKIDNNVMEKIWVK